MKTKMIALLSSAKGQNMLKLTGFAIAVFGLTLGTDAYTTFDHITQPF